MSLQEKPVDMLEIWLCKFTMSYTSYPLKSANDNKLWNNEKNLKHRNHIHTISFPMGTTPYLLC